MRTRRGMKNPEPVPRKKADEDLELILREIEKEAVPERLLELAMKLQATLAGLRKNEPSMEGE